MANAHAILRFQPATEMLGRIGLDPADVELVILTHGHFDHAAGLADFPRAEVVIQRRELEMLESLDELSPRRRWLANAIDPQTPHDVRALRDAGRLTTVDGETELLPGITVAPAYDAHTTGSQYVMVDTDHDGRWIFAGDVIYVYENLEGAGGDGVMIPIGLANGSQELDLLAMEAMLDAVGGETRRVLPVHDEQLWSRFPSHEWSDGLRMAEITLAPDHPSRLPAVAASGR
jgi:glyoxylase-like metal-dependent hydrolase (beta-lactamase superfamily II)